MASRKNAAASRGRPQRARHKTTLLAEKLMQADAKEIVRAIVHASATGELSAVQLIPERFMPAQRDSKLAALAQRAEEAVLKAVAAGKLAVADAHHLLRFASEIRNSPLYRLSDIQRRAVIVEIGMVRGFSVDDMLAELQLDDQSWGAATESVSRATWDQIDAYYGFPSPNSAAR